MSAKKSDTKRILIPIIGFGPQGGYRVLSELANAWIRAGHECTFLVPATSPEPYFPTTAKILRCDRNSAFSDQPSSKRARGIDNVLSIFAGLKCVGKNYDVILGNHCLTAWPVYLANCGSARKIYYIQAYEPDYYSPFKDPIKHLLARGSYLLRLRQIANASIYQGWGINPEAVIPPGIDLTIFTQKIDKESFANKQTITLGTIGRSEPYKGTGTALAAYRMLRKHDQRLRMKVAFGNVEPADDIEIVPIRGDAQLASFYRSIDILLVTCRGQHGAPHYPLIESMASGTPVIHTGYCPGDTNNSWPASDTSATSIANATTDLIYASEDEIKRRVTNARKEIEGNFSWNVVAQQFESLFS
ncbi:glycosyltransferase family 4 protein [Aquabacterium sp.]|uniref:glycosyltransferase family 4 protein n=1 Tax=Aquabacterium sp. TaxID=1872578 RepID=UPI003BAF3224